MSNPLTVKQFTDYLNSKFPKGLACPLCRMQDWEVRAANGVIDSVEEAEAATPEEIQAELEGRPAPSTNSTKDKMASSCIAIRCGNCGNLIYFDRLFVKGRIHD